MGQNSTKNMTNFPQQLKMNHGQILGKQLQNIPMDMLCKGDDSKKFRRISDKSEDNQRFFKNLVDL